MMVGQNMKMKGIITITITIIMMTLLVVLLLGCLLITGRLHVLVVDSIIDETY